MITPTPTSESCACFRAPCDCPALGANNQERPSNVLQFYGANDSAAMRDTTQLSTGGISITTTVLILGGLALAWYAYRKFFRE